jgi:MFS family permease
MTGVVLALYLATIGWEIGRTGLLVGVGLAGTAVAALLTSVFANRMGRRRTLTVLGLLTALGYLVLAAAPNPAILLILAFFGMVNGLGRDRGPAYALEQALLPETTAPERRTYLLAWYALVLDAGLAFGSLLAALPFVLRERLGWASLMAYRAAWLVGAGLAVVSVALYAGLSRRVELSSPSEASKGVWLEIAPESKQRITRLAALMSMDSLGGGFLSSALVSYWFFYRFGIGEEWLGAVFFAARVANAASHLVAAWLARRIGLLNTMVFTHLPSSLFLMMVPFAPTLPWAVALFLVREALVEMDVPTRQSFLLAVVRPEERAFASSLTALTRNVSYVVAPAAAGLAMRLLAAASPLFFGGGLKVAYDVLLYAAFRGIKPPEEAAANSAGFANPHRDGIMRDQKVSPGCGSGNHSTRYTRRPGR